MDFRRTSCVSDKARVDVTSIGSRDQAQTKAAARTCRFAQWSKLSTVGAMLVQRRRAAASRGLKLREGVQGWRPLSRQAYAWEIHTTTLPCKPTEPTSMLISFDNLDTPPQNTFPPTSSPQERALFEICPKRLISQLDISCR